MKNFEHELDNMFEQFEEYHKNAAEIEHNTKLNTYGLIEMREKYERAKQIIDIPKNYSSIFDFIRFYSIRLSTLVKYGSMELNNAMMTLFQIWILFTLKYEKKYNTTDKKRYNNTFFYTSGVNIDDDNKAILKFCRLIKSNYYD